MSNENELDEIIGFYTEAYEEGWYRSTKNTHQHRKGDARRYAASVCPTGQKLVMAHIAYLNKKTGETPEVIAGRELVTRIRQLCVKFRQEILSSDTSPVVAPAITLNGNGHKAARDIPEPKAKRPKSTRDKFEAACALGFVPQNNIAAALLGVDESYASRLRSGLSGKYKFTQVDNGYMVAPRRSKQDLAIEAIEVEMAALSKKLAAIRR